MDLHHLPRYVPLPHHPPPNFSDDRPLRHHHHHHLPPLPPPPPISPHPQSYRPLPPPPPPPPPPYNPDHSQFTFLNHHHRSPIEYNPRVSDRIQFGNLIPDSRSDSWADPPRVPPETRIDLESSYRPHRPFAVDRYRREIEGTSLYRSDFIGGFERNRGDELLLRGRLDNDYGNDKGDFRFDHGERSRNFEYDEPRVVSSPNISRESGLNLGNYGSSFGSAPDNERVWNNRDENRRWAQDRPPSRELPNPQFEMENNDFSNLDSVRGDSVRRVPQTYSRGSRENHQEPVRSPRKKLPRKSALLRIQLAKPSNRVRNVEQHFSSAYFDDSDSSSFRGKDPSDHSDHRMEEDREVSPVQLDVSFKSNSLVAKPIVAASSDAVVSDRNLTPRNRKIRRLVVQDTNLSDSPLTKLDGVSSEAESSAHVLDCVSNSYTVKDTGSGAICDAGSHPCSNGFSDSPETTLMKGLDSDVGGNSVDSSGAAPSLSIRKKKKIITPLSRVSSSQSEEKYGERANAVSTRLFQACGLEEEITHSEGEKTSADKEATCLLESGNSDESQQAAVSDNNSGRSSAPSMKRKRTSTSPVLDLSSRPATKSDDGTVTTNKSVHDLPTIQNSDKSGSIEMQSGSKLYEIGSGVSQQSLRSELPELLGNHVLKGSFEAVALAESNADLSSAVETKVPESITNINSFKLVEDKFDNEVTGGQGKPNISDIDVSKDENCTLEGFPKLISSVGVFTTVDSLIAEEPKIDGDIVCADSTPLVKRKRKIENPQSGLSSQRIRGTSKQSPSTSDIPATGVGFIDRSQDLIVAEEEVSDSGDLSFDTSSQTCEDDLSISLGPKTSPKSRKKRQKNVEVPLNDGKGLLESENKVAELSNKTAFSADLPPCSKLTTILLEKTVAEGSLEAVGFTDNALEFAKETCYPLESESEPIEKDTPLMAASNHQRDITDVETGSRGEKSETTHHGIHSDSRAVDLDLILSTADMERSSYSLEKGDVHASSDTQNLCAEGNSVLATNSSDGLMESVPDTLYNVTSPETVSIDLGSCVLNAELSIRQTSNEKMNGDDRKNEKSLPGCSVSVALSSSSQDTNINIKSDLGSAHSVNAKSGANRYHDTKRTSQSSNLTSGKSSMAKSQTNSSVHFNPLNKKVPLNPMIKSRTWHRTGNPSPPLPGKNSNPPKPQSLAKAGKVHSNSYVRKGNSLVRKPSPVISQPCGSHFLSSSVYRLNPLGIDELKKSTGFQTERGGSNLIVERPKTGTLPHSMTLSNCKATRNGGSDSSSNPSVLSKNMDLPNESCEHAPRSSEAPEHQTALTNNLEIQSVQDAGNKETANNSRIIYVKRKSNQLVAASSFSDMPVRDVEKTKTLSSDAYYKRRRNQLIRKSSGSHIKQRAAFSDGSLSSEGQGSLKVFQGRSASKRRSGKGVAKTSRNSKFSMVWTLCETLSSKKDNSVQHKMVWPQLFPWKRMAYWRSFMHNSPCNSNISSLSSISRKLLFSRKRDTVYTRSARGFSLRRSKVLSVGGSSLKWSKSIERDSRKANEEATLAVAAAEKKKKEQTSAAMKTQNNSSRERIFRIGSVRYRMDSTRRMLQRISDDEESPCSAALESGRDAKKSYIPRRLVIGDDEYVRIGNGNQLVRDPKRRTRLLASEKVRWSLHTARLRLARKSKYCQFFTRFGKCNKDGGKCPYIHDPSKIAVCTKFLSGACSNPNCKLTHKIIPERMQDCSYFLQGVCSNESCPYRHVNVNRNASICEGFLRGYCADGNECRKKHSYVCPVYEATGICLQGSTCKLHHPKNRVKGKKRKPLREPKNAQGRYFGSGNIEIAECISSVTEKCSAKDNDDIFIEEGRFADFISVGFSDEEAEETNDPTGERKSVCDDDTLDLQEGDLEELIKPVRLWNRSVVTEASPAIDSPSERTASYVSEESCYL